LTGLIAMIDKIFIDSNIWIYLLSALTANCQYLISEDMQNNQVIDGMILKNIFN
jgi:predicted nucleic acid-binding protein